ncbi:hypothetical protein ANACAC_02509 [Anaerostipes caccae L1-92]|uniref:Uncharacterized protein n=1 Tax=Anaerostipes caccae (strain DSM 14662 / CCUG 47493 / JCM 13470 / NCIMB 13811 / L1-92) TaxID=411490 RepID=B0MFH5_ANACD|nr:hypothetical protein ANACAC_02509 [Anaerostipes caccae L1-92]
MIQVYIEIQPHHNYLPSPSSIKSEDMEQMLQNTLVFCIYFCAIVKYVPKQSDELTSL